MDIPISINTSRLCDVLMDIRLRWSSNSNNEIRVHFDKGFHSQYVLCITET